MSSKPDLSPSNGALVWVLSSALIVTILFVSFSLYFSRSRAADAPSSPTVSQADITNNAPEIAIDGFVVSINASPANPLVADSNFDSASTYSDIQYTITPTASSTLNAYVYIIARDSNGWEDIDPDSVDPGSIAYSGYLKTGADQCVSTDNYDCYVPFTLGNCALLAHSTHVVQVQCPVDLSYYTKAGTWDASFTVSDRGGLTDTYNGTFAINSVLAYSFSPTTINFGSVTIPFSGVTNSNKPVNFANAGNTSIVQLQVDHTAMACAVGGASGGSIPASDMAYSTSSISSLSDYYEIGVTSGTDFGFPIPAQTTTQIQVNTLYNHLVGVPNGTSGSCSGTITFTPSS